MTDSGDKPAAGDGVKLSGQNPDSFELEVFILANSSKLLAYIRQIFPSALKARYDPLDVYQTTAFEAFRRADTFRHLNDQTTLGWLFLLARRQIGMALRRERRERRLQPVQGDLDQGVVVKLLTAYVADQHTPSQSVFRREALLSVEQALQSLPPHLSEAIRLRYLQGKTMGEVAEEMGRSERAVATLCYRGLRLLQRKLRSYSRHL